MVSYIYLSYLLRYKKSAEFTWMCDIYISKMMKLIHNHNLSKFEYKGIVKRVKSYYENN